uniref:Uncharacterized protein n=1 Tax=Oryza sativa subsp. japonica TaxID=39947 RepID=Q337S7_ORYSJ|nr:hypothetical protein LOC_Os10g30809 [Oryza sativa Japonica Group]
MAGCTEATIVGIGRGRSERQRGANSGKEFKIAYMAPLTVF